MPLGGVDAMLYPINGFAHAVCYLLCEVADYTNDAKSLKHKGHEGLKGEQNGFACPPADAPGILQPGRRDCLGFDK